MVHAGARPKALVAPTQVVEDAHLLPQVVADDVRVPPLRERLDEVAQVVVRALGRLERLRAARRRRVERPPGRTYAGRRCTPRPTSARRPRARRSSARSGSTSRRRSRSRCATGCRRSRSMSAIAVEKNSQCPRCDSKRKWSTGCGLPRGGRVQVVAVLATEVLLDGAAPSLAAVGRSSVQRWARSPMRVGRLGGSAR